MLNLQSGDIGISEDYYSGADSISDSAVQSLQMTLCELLTKSSREFPQYDSGYLVPEYFTVDDIEVMQVFSDSGLGRIKKTPLRFRRWLQSVGVPDDFCFQAIVPAEEMPAGAGAVYSDQQICVRNFAARRKMNPNYLVIGSCSDGSLIVLDLRTDSPSVGYVAIQEVGDEDCWDEYYICISPTFGSFLHDLNCLRILPYDYYQARELGYGIKWSDK